jgi:predicted small integral membrane protein
MIVRLSKAGLTLSLGIFLLIVGIDNILDYGINFTFVQHVMSMTRRFPRPRCAGATSLRTGRIRSPMG